MINYSDVKEVIEAQAAEKAAAEKAAEEKREREEIEWHEKYEAAQLEYKTLAIRAAINSVKGMTDQIAGINKLRADFGIQGPRGLWVKWQYYLTAGLLAEAVKADPENPINTEAAEAVAKLIEITCELKSDAVKMLEYLKKGRILVPDSDFLENGERDENNTFKIYTVPAHAPFSFLGKVTGVFEDITVGRARKGERDIEGPIMAYLREHWESDIHWHRWLTEPAYKAACRAASEARRAGNPQPSPARAPAAVAQAPRQTRDTSFPEL
jgi:hypothetical protein